MVVSSLIKSAFFWRGTEAVTTAPTRNRLGALRSTWVRIPPSPPISSLGLDLGHRPTLYSHGRRTPHLQSHLHEPGQALRGLCPQGEPGRLLGFHRDRADGVRRARRGGGGSGRGTPQDRVRGREEELHPHARGGAYR